MAGGEQGRNTASKDNGSNGVHRKYEMVMRISSVIGQRRAWIKIL